MTISPLCVFYVRHILHLTLGLPIPQHDNDRTTHLRRHVAHDCFGFEPSIVATVWAEVAAQSLMEGLLVDVKTGEFLLELESEPCSEVSVMSELKIATGSCWVLQFSHEYNPSREGSTDVHVDLAEEIPTYTLKWSGSDTHYPARMAMSYGTPMERAVLRHVLSLLPTLISQLSIMELQSIPEVLLISGELLPYMATLQPFLSIIPNPFTWMLESPALSRLLLAVDSTPEIFLCHMELAVDANTKGNHWYKGNELSQALTGYGVAVAHIKSAMKMDLTTAQLAAVRKVLSVVLTNRASVLLEEGRTVAVEQAVIDAQAAESLAPSYYKP
ncbi:hypothetical protein BV25DRAFT_1835934 [Artomyces pyxidatus]|uniref:Uncharacterized protein n=1 Tax=Artomyces pyxidatus TaxID=48021 RepID=A0ACB8TD75_9AGAM|nr:hypothetical protein BV25DRAFT_1835934 [Artomyces pyxidatus]